MGTGEALALGRRGDADVLLVHAPADERAFMDAGHGSRRLPVMYNDYVIVGPPDDPAGVRGADVSTALDRIARLGSFISRGDSSGTHRRELGIWAASQVAASVRDRARVEIGQGMGEALTIASEREAYTLTDRGTYLALRDALALEVLVEGGADLINPYSVITVTGALHERAADALADWLTGDSAAALIRTFGIETHGEPLFFPGPPPPADG